MTGKNIGASVQARLKNLVRETGVDMPTLLRRYVQERLVYRMSASPEAGNFCLKGGLLLAAYNGGDLMRPTEDVDFNGFDPEGDVGMLERALRSVFATEVEDDGVTFMPDTMRIVKDRVGVVPGGKVTMVATVGTARVDLRVDVGFGNVVTPGVRMIEVPTLLEGLAPRPTVPAYPLETVVAEKLHAMVQFGDENTRLKDFYDLWLLSGMHAFDGANLSDAIAKTFEGQRREIPEGRPEGLGEDYAAQQARPWEAFLRKVGRVGDAPFAEVVERIADFAVPAMAAARGDAPIPGEWVPSEGWSGLAAQPAP